MNVKLIWATPDADKIIGYVAHVSNPENQDNENVAGLLQYCAKHHHWSVFEMATACIEINTTRDIGRQILRHRSFSFSEFSGRYQSYDKLDAAPLRECRLQDTKNRQNSLPCADIDIAEWWAARQRHIQQQTSEAYEAALSNGIAKEQARALLPEGLTSSRMYMSGTLRSWVTYLQTRLDPSTQREHRQIASQVLEVLRAVAPVTMGAFFPMRDSY
jgi:thymidylate synthase (FAD)